MGVLFFCTLVTDCHTSLVIVSPNLKKQQNDSQLVYNKFVRVSPFFTLLRHSKRNFSDVFLEKHWRSVISRSVCDYYLEAQRANPNDIAPVIATPHHYLISVQRGGVSFVAVCMEEIPPLFVIEFLHRVVDTFQVSPKL